MSTCFSQPGPTVAVMFFSRHCTACCLSSYSHSVTGHTEAICRQALLSVCVFMVGSESPDDLDTQEMCSTVIQWKKDILDDAFDYRKGIPLFIFKTQYTWKCFFLLISLAEKMSVTHPSFSWFIFKHKSHDRKNSSDCHYAKPFHTTIYCQPATPHFSNALSCLANPSSRNVKEPSCVGAAPWQFGSVFVLYIKRKLSYVPSFCSHFSVFRSFLWLCSQNKLKWVKYILKALQHSHTIICTKLKTNIKHWMNNFSN